MPKVSVIIPLYNKASFIERSISSVLAQTLSDLELIVVDDGSTDGSGALVQRNKDPRIIYLSQANAGPGAARNTGARKASSPLVAFLDADDEWLPQYLQESLSLLGSFEEVVAVSSCYKEEPGTIDRSGYWRRRGISEGPYGFSETTTPPEAITRVAYLCPWSVVIKRDVLLSLGGFYEKRCLYAEDAHLWFKLLLNHKVLYSLAPRVVYHREASELTSQKKGPRPIEPFLTDPQDIESKTPAALLPLIRRTLATRALKTACLYGYWSKPEVARDLVKKFLKDAPLTSPYFFPALLSTTPLSKLARYLR